MPTKLASAGAPDCWISAEGDGGSSSDAEPADVVPWARVLPSEMGAVTVMAGSAPRLVGVKLGVGVALWVGLLVVFPLGVKIAAMSTRRLL